MEWLRNWSWRLTILALPWQTRLMFSDASIYATWFLMILSISLAFQAHRAAPSSRNRYSTWIGVTVFILILASVFTIFPAGTWQWWVQVLLLGFFGWSLIISKVDAREFLVWSVIAIIPHAILAIQQGITQQVIGTKWLGISPQLPETRGVAVVDVNGVRHLRAYGGLPYPNILGGWLAIGFPAAIWLAVTAKRRQKNIIWSCIAVLFIVALVLSHSRSAWLAVILMTALLGYHLYKTQSLYRLKIPLILSVIALIFSLTWQWPMLTTRVTGEGRLEARSISERVSGIEAGISAFKNHPLYGVGQNAFISVDNLGPIPHQIPLLILAETGLVGIAGIVTLLMLFLRSVPFNKRRLLMVGIPLIIIALFDHYLWSYWSGQTLASFCVIWYALEGQDIDKMLKS
jgi:putative inorganic carbon (HCO3(-)) transporter